MPPALLARLGSDPASGKGALPRPVAAWVEDHFPIKASGEAEWSADAIYLPRSEERRVGTECVSKSRCRWSTYLYKNNKVPSTLQHFIYVNHTFPTQTEC